jgi:hypothetical protein
VPTSGHIRSNSTNSPILSYFLSNPSPTATLKSKFGGTAPVFEAEEEEHEGDTIGPSPSFGGLTSTIGRRASLAAPRIPSATAAAAVSTSPPATERGAGLLRRLSLGVSAVPQPKSPTLAPAPPPNTAVDGPMPFSAASPSLPSEKEAPLRRARRRATVSSGRAPRAPSPMGERILKGHFDGFN